jgi:hypothetical protein
MGLAVRPSNEAVEMVNNQETSSSERFSCLAQASHAVLAFHYFSMENVYVVTVW